MGDLIDLALLFEPDLDARQLFSGRGDANRPGVRGLTLHRPAFSGIADHASADVSRELAASLVLIDGRNIQRQSYRWFSTDPVRLDQLLEPEKKASLVKRVLWTKTGVFERLRIAARWHAKSHWSIDPHEAVLCIGIAFDALLGSAGGPQRRELSERFAYLHPIPSEREHRYKLFSRSYYTARSEVAHGLPCSALGEPGFCRQMSSDLRVAAIRLLEVVDRWKVETDEGFSEMFAAIKWGRNPSIDDGAP